MDSKEVLKTVGIAAALHAVFTISIPWVLLTLTRDARSLFVSLGPVRWLGAGVILVGVYLYVSSVVRLLSRKTSALPGQPPAALETEGWYRYVRHPLLLGVVLILFGEAVAAQSVILFAYAGAYWLWLNVFVARHEEPELHATFGEAYGRYCREVPRWLPRLVRRHATSKRRCRV